MYKYRVVQAHLHANLYTNYLVSIDVKITAFILHRLVIVKLQDRVAGSIDFLSGKSWHVEVGMEERGVPVKPFLT